MTNNHKVYEFDSAIVRKPSQSVTGGLRAVNRGNPTYAGVTGEHDAYVAALETAGAAVQVLEPLEEFPDSIFVEDPALVFHEGAILLRPGIDSREGETAAIAPVLRERFDTVLELADGYVDGGDVLYTRDNIIIGLSARTSQVGANALIDCLAQFGRKGVVFNTPANVLHFKTDCSLVDDETVLTTARLAASGVFENFKQIITPSGEEAGANALRVNDTVFVGKDFPGIISMLVSEGYKVVPLETSQIGMIDAGLSCMSLRWHS